MNQLIPNEQRGVIATIMHQNDKRSGISARWVLSAGTWNQDRCTPKRWIGKHPDRIAIFFLPPDVPEYSPDEYLNQDVKLEISKRPKARSEVQLLRSLKSHMCQNQRNKEKVRRFFNRPKVQYANAM